MVQFIRLHSANDNSPVIIAVNQIIDASVCEKYENRKITTFDFIDDNNEYLVNESIDKIFAILKDSGFVRIHRKANNTPAIFNIDCFIIASLNYYKTSTISLTNGIEIEVNETPEKIYNLIKEAYNLKNKISTEDT